MYYKLDDKQLETIKRIEKITFTDYEVKGDMIPFDSLMSALEDMVIYYQEIEEQKEDLEQDLRDNYKPICEN